MKRVGRERTFILEHYDVLPLTHFILLRTKCMYTIFIMHDAYSYYKKVLEVMRDYAFYWDKSYGEKISCGIKKEWASCHTLLFFMTKSRSTWEHPWNTRRQNEHEKNKRLLFKHNFMHVYIRKSCRYFIFCILYCDDNDDHDDTSVELPPTQKKLVKSYKLPKN